MPGEVLFFHLTVRPLEAVLPEIVEKTLARGWRAVLRAGSRERVEALSALLWTFEPASFLPHGSAADGRPERQPVWLTAGDELPNDPQALLLCDGAACSEAEIARMTRVATLFDGHDPERLAQARALWRLAETAGARAADWAQGERGAWEVKRERG